MLFIACLDISWPIPRTNTAKCLRNKLSIKLQHNLDHDLRHTVTNTQMAQSYKEISTVKVHYTGFKQSEWLFKNFSTNQNA